MLECHLKSPVLFAWMQAAAKEKFSGNPVKAEKNSGIREERFMEKISARGTRALIAFNFFSSAVALGACGNRFGADPGRFLFTVRLLPGLADINAAFKEGPVLDRNPRGHDVAGKRTIAANVHAIAGR